MTARSIADFVAKKMTANKNEKYGMSCDHLEVDVLNEFELIRKYRCRTCGAVMMCACDRHRGETFLPHQLDRGVDFDTQCRVPVTHGFQPNICRECRGLPLTPALKAAAYGWTSKIKRFYWRELQFLEFELLEAAGVPSRDFYGSEYTQERERVSAQALEEIKSLHRASPKYTLETESEAAFLLRVSVDILPLEADVLDGGELLHEVGAPRRVENYVSEVLQDQGFEVMPCESRPLHVLFAVLLAPLIQDHADPNVRLRLFGERASFEAAGESETQVPVLLPDDFGTLGYAARRHSDIEHFFDANLSAEREALVQQFDSRVDDAFALRQYLWAHHDEDLAKARRIVEVLAPEFTLATLRYLVDDYWANYLGWPDLLFWRGTNVQFAEVKLSRDKLSDEQRHWIEANREKLHFPFKLVKVHRRKRL